MINELFEDDWILAVCKSSGTPSEAQTSGTSGSLEEQVQARAGSEKLLLLHRLDTGTSGVVLFAKSRSIFDEMRLKFSERSLKKHYWAFAHPPSGASPFESFPWKVDLPLAHHPKSRKRMIVLPPGFRRAFRGKPLPALTWVHGAGRGTFLGAACLQLQVQIETGVMHQIRVHLAHLGLPLLGDPLYGDRTREFPRLGLHARSVSFILRGYHYHVEAPLPGWIPDSRVNRDHSP